MSIADRIRTLQQGKAISHRPDLRYRVHVLRQEAGQEVSQELEKFADYAKVYQSYVWVRKAVSVYSNAIAPLTVRVVDGDDKAIDAHPITELLAYINDTMSPAHLWGLYPVHMLLSGEFFLEIVPDSRGQPSELWPRRPDKVAVLPDKARPLYPAVAGYKFGDEEYAHDEMIQDKLANPLSVWRGCAPITAVRAGITIDLFAQAWSKSFLKRGARPDWALIAPEGLTQTEREEYETTIIDKFGGHDKTHKPIVLEQGVTDIKVLSFPPKDIEWLEQRKVSRDEVGAVFNIPDEVMGYGRDTYENMDAAHRWLWLLALAPFVGHRDTTLTSFFTRTRPMLKPGERIATDLSGVGALRENLTPKIGQASELWAMGVPFNTIDQQLGLGIGPIPGGDTGYVPVMLWPVGSSASTGNGGKQQAAKGSIFIKAAGPEYGSERHKALIRKATMRWTPHERRLREKLLADFGKQEKSVLEAIAGREQPPVAADDIFDLEEWVAYFMVAYEPFFTDATRAGGAAVLADLGVDMPFDLGSPHVQRAIREMQTKFADDINGENLRLLDEMLRDLLSESVGEGWDVFRIQQELGKRTKDVFGLRKEMWQRERIARTEMHKAAEMGGFEGARQSGIELKKAWLAAIDGRERDTHREAHFRYQGEPIPIDAQFEVGRDMMTRPGGGTDPAENINCRCTSFFVAAGE